MSWEDAWREGRTGWDAGEAPPALTRLVREGALPTGLTLVPGCGAGYCVFELADAARPVIGIDVAPTAASRFEALRAERGVDGSLARIHTGDVFAFDPGEPAKLWWDYTFFCALDPELRAKWATTIDERLADDGELATLIFPMGSIGRPDGPPYEVSLELYQATLGPGWRPFEVDRDVPTHPGREGFEMLARWRRA